jgi:PBP1b-binding outer membrane lipoprotein LpoB
MAVVTLVLAAALLSGCAAAGRANPPVASATPASQDAGLSSSTPPAESLSTSPAPASATAQPTVSTTTAGDAQLQSLLNQIDALDATNQASDAFNDLP